MPSRAKSYTPEADIVFHLFSLTGYSKYKHPKQLLPIYNPLHLATPMYIVSSLSARCVRVNASRAGPCFWPRDSYRGLDCTSSTMGRLHHFRQGHQTVKKKKKGK
jgi:hypothetical protein